VGASILNGFGCGATELGTSRFVTALRPGGAALYLNLLGATFGLISMLTPYYVALVRRLGGSWREAFLYTIAGSLLCLIWFVPIRCPEDRDGDPARTRLPELVRAVMSREVRLFYLVVLFFFTVEVGIGTWLIEYVTRARGLSADTGSSYLSLYYGSIMTGRFAGSLVVERIGRGRLLRLASLAALLCIAAGALGPGRAILLLPLSGLFFSVIFPTATACVSAIGTENPGAVFGVLFAFVGIGGMCGPWLIGLVNDLLGVEWGIGLAIGFGLALALSIHFAVKPPPKAIS
jgi:fucose permease